MKGHSIYESIGEPVGTSLRIHSEALSPLPKEGTRLGSKSVNLVSRLSLTCTASRRKNALVKSKKSVISREGPVPDELLGIEAR